MVAESLAEPDVLALISAVSWEFFSLGKNNIAIDKIAGTSAGAMIAALWAFGVPTDEIYQEAAKLRWPHISKLAVTSLGLISNEAIGEIIDRILGRVKIEDAPIPLYIIATDIETGEEVVMEKGDLASAVVASTCLPGIFQPINRQGRLLVDGGLGDNVPVKPLKERGADIVVAVNVSPHGQYKKPRHLIDILLNTYDITTNAATTHQMEIADVIIAPDVTQFSRADLKQLPALYKKGYQATLAALPQIREVLAKKQPRGWRRVLNWV